MCGIFGIISTAPIERQSLHALSKHARQRGVDSSGLLVHDSSAYRVLRAECPITKLVRQVDCRSCDMVMGHSRLVTNSQADNQPVVRDGICVLHNGIIVNDAEIWSELDSEPRQQIDSEVIAGLATEYLSDGGGLAGIDKHILGACEGVVACAMAIPGRGKLVLFSNNGSLYTGQKDGALLVSSEQYPLDVLECTDIRQITDGVVIDIPTSDHIEEQAGTSSRTHSLVPSLPSLSAEERHLQYPQHNLRRCTKCVLPETMPYISFDESGVCNYCQHYRLRNVPRPTEDLFKLVEPYRKAHGRDCIVPFSGGRDSCYGLHLIATELKMKPIAYTYDWGMVTDLGRRNISRMCAALGVENIIVAADISKKRDNIRKNLVAWLKSPHLGMVSMLTAGDKHFFRHVETIKKQTDIQLNLWGVNPLEVTHFKAGFLGVPPDFAETLVYSNGALKQLRYQRLRFKAMLRSPRYFNASLWDTLSGEYYRSFTKKDDYFHVFDYWRWDERLIDETLAEYDWERAPDTSTTWRIGDGTAALYNYIYYTVAGFTEHDTFRSNQIREGDLTRAQAMTLIADENQPRYPNIRWYLDAINLDFEPVIKTINSIPKLYTPCES